MSTRFEWTSLTPEEVDEMTGMANLRRRAKTDPVAALAVKRIDAAFSALQPDIDRFKAEWERQWMEGPSDTDGLALLIEPS